MANARWHLRRGSVNLLLSVGLSVLAASSAADTTSAQETRDSVSAPHLVSAKEGHKIAAAALDSAQSGRNAQDCSHLVQQIYADAGYDYPYASSFDLYAGNGNFRRVRHPQPGDLIAWRGHVGIVVNPKQHSFYSLVRSGLETEDYLAPYWRSRGTPRFYRYVVGPDSDVITAKIRSTSTANQTSSSRGNSNKAKTVEAQEEAEQFNSTAIPEETALRTKVLSSRNEPIGSSPSGALAPSATEVSVTAEQRPPTAAQVLSGIAELNNAAAAALRGPDALEPKTPIVIFDDEHVEKIGTKRDQGWANVRIDSHVVIVAEGADFKRKRETVRWDLRRNAAGWVVIAPSSRTYVPREVAVRELAARLAEMTQGDPAAQHHEVVLGQEARIANLLSALLDK